MIQNHTLINVQVTNILIKPMDFVRIVLLIVKNAMIVKLVKNAIQTIH